MKSFSLVILLGATLALLSSCNNGKYAANPSGKIPSPGNSPNALPGVIDCKFYYVNYEKFPNGAWTDNSGIRSVSGSVIEINGSDTVTSSVGFIITDYKGAGTYRLNDTSNQLTFAASAGTNIYGATQGNGFGEVIVEQDANGTMIGTFTAKLLGVTQAGFNLNDSLHLAEGRFNVNKHP